MNLHQPTASVTIDGNRRILSVGETDFGGFSACLSVRSLGEAQLLALTLTNKSGENSPIIDDPCTLAVNFETAAAVSYHTLHGDSCGAESFLPKEFTVTEPYHEEPRDGRSSDTTGFPYFELDDGDGALCFGNGWTGQWYRELTPTDGGISLRIGLCDAHFYLKPGESVELPTVLVVAGNDMAAARRNLRETLREYLSPKAMLGERFSMPISIQCFDRYFQKLDGSDGSLWWASEEGQIAMVDAAQKLDGIDTLWLDAAWFAEGFPNGVGNYRFAEGFPNGLKKVSDYAHAHGMRFVLWFEPERVHEGSDLYPQAEKLLSRSEDSENRLYDLGDEAAHAWLTQTLQNMIVENGIDVYRQDFNFNPLDYWRENDEPDRRGIHEIKHVNGLYRLWDALLAQDPGLMIDNCSSGGRRLDLGLMQRSVSLWRSDTGCFPETEERRVNEWSTNQILTLSEYLPFHSCATWSYEAYAVRSTATQGLACNFDVLNPNFDFAAAKQAVAEVKRLAHYWDGDFYPLTEPTLREDVWCAYQLSLGDKGVAYAFRRKDCEEREKPLCLRAIDPAATYAVTITDEQYAQTHLRLPGSELASGICVEIAQKRGSVVVEYEKE